jgi:hypothetical protein
MEYTPAQILLGRIGYEAYSQQTKGVSVVTGDKLPAHDKLRPEIQQAWAAAGIAIRDAVERDFIEQQAKGSEVDHPAWPK